jgi:hypothetical protein
MMGLIFTLKAYVFLHFFAKRVPTFTKISKITQMGAVAEEMKLKIFKLLMSFSHVSHHQAFLCTLRLLLKFTNASSTFVHF